MVTKYIITGWWNYLGYFTSYERELIDISRVEGSFFLIYIE